MIKMSSPLIEVKFFVDGHGVYRFITAAYRTFALKLRFAHIAGQSSYPVLAPTLSVGGSAILSKKSF